MAERADLRRGGGGSRSRFAWCVAAVLAAAAASPRAAGACDITCSPATECTCSGSGLCTITTGQSLAAGAGRRCSGRDTAGRGGAVTILADDLTVNAQRSVRAERSGSEAFGVRIELTGELSGQTVGGDYRLGDRQGTGGGVVGGGP